jgi:hypothetical protein
MKTRDERRRLRLRAKSKDKAFAKLPPDYCGCKGYECDWCFTMGNGVTCKYMRNPRKLWGTPTEQEQRAAIGEREQMKEQGLA